MKQAASSLLAGAALLLVVCSPIQAQSGDGPYLYAPIVPCRLLDTRLPSEPGAFVSNQTRTYSVSERCPAVPSSAKAVHVTVAALSPTHDGHLRVFSAGLATPAISSVNFRPAWPATTNGILVNVKDVDPEAGLSVFAKLADGAGTVHVIVDVVGVYGQDEAMYATFHAVPPCRLLDTRRPAGDDGGPALQSDVTRWLSVADRCAVPSNAVAVSLTATAVGAPCQGHLRLGSSVGGRTTTAVLNFPTGTTRAAPTIAGFTDGFFLNGQSLGLTAKLADPSAELHVVLDITGYYAGTPPPPPPPEPPTPPGDVLFSAREQR